MKKAPMPGGLVLVKQAQFGSLAIDCYTDGRGNFYMTRDQIGQALEYPHPRRAIETIHKRHKERLDRLSTVLKTRTVDGKEREVVLYQSRGVYEICRHSTQPKADAFYDCVYDILEGLRLGWLELQVHKGTPVWQEARAASIDTRKAESDTIQRFVEYAKAQGSGHAERYYTSLSALANKAANTANPRMGHKKASTIFHSPYRAEQTVGQSISTASIKKMRPNTKPTILKFMPGASLYNIPQRMQRRIGGNDHHIVPFGQHIVTGGDHRLPIAPHNADDEQPVFQL